MSKITSKNLSYDTTLPPFLQRMQQGHSNLDGRHERTIARPKRARTDGEEEDDAPAYVDEHTNHTLSKEEYAALVKGDSETKPSAAQIEDEAKQIPAEEGQSVKLEEKVAAIGASKKRKMGKIIGGEDADDGQSLQKIDSTGITHKSSKPKKKAKKIMLSFDADEG